MTYSKHTSSLRAGLIAGVAFLAMSSGAAAAGEGSEALRAVFASDGEITAGEVKRLARNHLKQLGFTRIGKSQVSARVGRVRFADGQWRIGVAFGGTSGHNRAVILFDAATGRLLASDLVEYVTGEPLEREASDTELAESRAEDN